MRFFQYSQSTQKYNITIEFQWQLKKKILVNDYFESHFWSEKKYSEINPLKVRLRQQLLFNNSKDSHFYDYFDSQKSKKGVFATHNLCFYTSYHCM